MTGNLSVVEPFVLETWGNADAIAINQDGYGPHRVLPPPNRTAAAAAAATASRATAQQAAAADPRDVTVGECGGEPGRQLWDWGSDGLVRNGGQWRSPIDESLSLSSSSSIVAAAAAAAAAEVASRCLNVKACKTDVILDTCLPTGPGCGGGAAGAPPAANEVFTLPPVAGGNITILLGHRRNCLTAAANGSVSVLACTPTSPASADQQWAYDPHSHHITRLSDGACLTAPAAAPPPGPPSPAAGGIEELMLGRPLQGVETLQISRGLDLPSYASSVASSSIRVLNWCVSGCRMYGRGEVGDPHAEQQAGAGCDGVWYRMLWRDGVWRPAHRCAFYCGVTLQWHL